MDNNTIFEEIKHINEITRIHASIFCVKDIFSERSRKMSDTEDYYEHETESSNESEYSEDEIENEIRNNLINAESYEISINTIEDAERLRRTMLRLIALSKEPVSAVDVNTFSFNKTAFIKAYCESMGYRFS